MLSQRGLGTPARGKIKNPGWGSCPCEGPHSPYRLARMDTPEGTGDAERLQDLVAGMDDIKDLLDGMTRLAATTLTQLTGARIECSMTLHRRKRPATISGSSDQAILLDGIEQRLGDGPCLRALRTGLPVLMQDLSADPRWPMFRSELTNQGFGSVLGIPLKLGTAASAALGFFAAAPGVFTDDITRDADLFGEVAGRALRLGLRIAAAELHTEDLTAALDQRAVIDTARGILMAQKRCTADEAFAMLRTAANTRHQKLHDVALEIVAGVTGTPGAPTSD
jgi:transcriptional regulator with GAF, ATPase, and Fis domain